LLCFGADASHGYERTHLSVLTHLAELLALYMQSGPTLAEDRNERLDSVESFSHQLDAGQLAQEEMPKRDVTELVQLNEPTQERSHRS
jgi:hypothetical protein